MPRIKSVYLTTIKDFKEWEKYFFKQYLREPQLADMDEEKKNMFKIINNCKILIKTWNIQMN